MAKEVKLKETSVFYLQAVLNSVPLEKLGEIKKSKFKAITMRRKLVKQLADLNDDFKKKVEKYSEIRSKYQKEFQEFDKELKERYELDEKKALEGLSEEEMIAKKAEFEATQGVEQKKESEEFALSIQAKMDEEAKETGLNILIYTSAGKEDVKRYEIVEYVNKEEEKELTVELDDSEDGQYKFVQRLFEENAMDVLPVEDVILPIGESLGL